MAGRGAGGDGGLVAQVGHQLELLGAERRAVAGERDHGDRVFRPARSARRPPTRSAAWPWPTRPLAERRPAGVVEHPAQPAPPEARWRTTGGGAAHGAGADGLGVERLRGGAGDDLHQRVEVQVGREGVPDPAHGDLQATTLLLEHVQAVAQPPGAPAGDERHQRQRSSGRRHGMRGHPPEQHSEPCSLIVRRSLRACPRRRGGRLDRRWTDVGPASGALDVPPQRDAAAHERQARQSSVSHTSAPGEREPPDGHPAHLLG